jgi:hypothetical protein
MKQLIIGDVHADGIPFSKAVNYSISHNIPLICVGDLIDNGSDGAKVCAQFLYLLKKGHARITWGNHEWKIYRHLLGNKVELGPPNQVTIDQMEEDPEFAKNFMEICSYCEEIININDKIYIAHAGVHPDYWEFGDDMHKKYRDVFKWGTVDFKAPMHHHKGQDYYIRTYDWTKYIPKDVHLFVGHDPAPLVGVPDFDNFQSMPQTFESQFGGRTTFTDCGAGKGGNLYGIIVNTDTTVIEQYLDFTDGF